MYMSQMIFVNYRIIKKQDLNLGKFFFVLFLKVEIQVAQGDLTTLFQSINEISTYKHSYSIVQNKWENMLDLQISECELNLSQVGSLEVAGAHICVCVWDRVWLRGLSWSMWSAGVWHKLKRPLTRVISSHSFIYSRKYILSTYYVLSTKMDVGIIMMNKTDTVPSLMDSLVQLGIWTIKYALEFW